jgi:hypothetical protein
MIVLAGLLAGSAAVLAAGTDAATAPQKPTADSASTDAAALRQRMQDNMRAMQEQMAKIHASTDPAERRALLAQHMAAMHGQLEMMRGMIGNQGAGMGGTMSRGAMQGNMGNCGQMMLGGSKGMMQMMMDQLQQHADAADTAPKSK